MGTKKKKNMKKFLTDCTVFVCFLMFSLTFMYGMINEIAILFLVGGAGLILMGIAYLEPKDGNNHAKR